MYVTAALLGLGIYILFFDLPKRLQATALENMWLPHVLVFGVLVAIHGGSAEGTVVAGLATLVFRWCLHRLADKRQAEVRKSQEEYQAEVDVAYTTFVTYVFLTLGFIFFIIMVNA